MHMMHTIDGEAGGAQAQAQAWGTSPSLFARPRRFKRLVFFVYPNAHHHFSPPFAATDAYPAKAVKSNTSAQTYD